jgi:hypothetical protein
VRTAHPATLSRRIAGAASAANSVQTLDPRFHGDDVNSMVRMAHPKY